MLLARISTGFWLIATFTLGLRLDQYLGPWYPLWFFLAVVVLGKAALEVCSLLNRTSARPSSNTAIGGVLAVVVANWVPHLLNSWTNPNNLLPGSSPYNPLEAVQVLAWPLWAFTAIVMLAFVAQSAQFQKPGNTMATIAGTILAVAYVGVLGSFLIQFRWLGGAGDGPLALALLIVTSKGADTGAYTFGRIAGHHKLWPRLSPNKTIEGALGGMASGLFGALATNAAARAFFSHPGIPWIYAAGFGLVVGAAAQLGDLMESMIKRDCASKDASDTLPGFGGVLDVLDSLLFASPIAYGYWLLISG